MASDETWTCVDELKRWQAGQKGQLADAVREVLAEIERLRVRASWGAWRLRALDAEAKIEAALVEAENAIQPCDCRKVERIIKALRGGDDAE